MIAHAPLALVADTGGTNTRMALARRGTLIAGTTTRFRNADYPGLDSIIADYLSQQRSLPDCAAFALAGLVEDGRRADMTNLGWQVDATEIARASGIRQVHLLNDLQAQGHALQGLPDSHLRPILPGQPSGDTRLVIGLGTGVNAAPVYPVRGGYVVPASEAGHMHLPLRGVLDYQLADWLVARRGVASVEDVLAGAGLERLYAFHAEMAGQHGGVDAATIMAQLEAGSPLAQEVGRHYVHLLAQSAASLALICLPYAGIYLIGGVARAFAPWMERFGFAEVFHDMGRMSAVMQRFPVKLVEDDYAALQGCASYLASMQT